MRHEILRPRQALADFQFVLQREVDCLLRLSLIPGDLPGELC